MKIPNRLKIKFVNTIIKAICEKDGIVEDDIRLVYDKDDRIWITTLNKDFSGDIENDDPELNQYHIVQTTNENINNSDTLAIKSQKCESEYDF